MPAAGPRFARMVVMSLAIEIHGLTRFFNDFAAVDGVDLKVERGT